MTRTVFTRAGFVLALLSPLFLITPAIASAATTVVTPANLNNWYLYNDQSDTVQSDTAAHGFITGPATPVVGTGSVHLTKTTNDSYGIATDQFAGTALSSITSLSYSTYRASGTSAQAPSLGFDVDSDSTDADTGYQGRLTYEPYFTQTVNTGAWQTWNTQDDAAGTGTGNWWFSSTPTHFPLSNATSSVCTQSSPCTWSKLIANYPNASVSGRFILRTNGATGEAFDGNVDNLTLNTSNFDFDPTPAPTTTYVNSDASSCSGQTPCYATIQTAVNAVANGGTVNVAAGTYEGFSVVNKTGITITGAGSSTTNIIPTAFINTGLGHKSTASNAKAVVFVNNSTNVLIQGLNIQSSTQTPGPDAIVFWNASSGTIKDSAVTGTYTIDGSQTGQGIAVDASGAQNATLAVVNTSISGFQKNGIDEVNGNSASSGSTGTVAVTITGGSITGAGPIGTIAQNGFVAWNKGGGTVTGTVDGTTISNFNYNGTQDATAAGALAVDGATISTVSNSKLLNNQINLSIVDASFNTSTTGSIDASKNYWGSANGPATTTLDGNINYSPFYSDAAMTTLVYGYATTTDGTNASTTVTTQTTMSGNSTENGSVAVTAVIPAGTVVTGDASWDGVIDAPTATNSTVSVSGFNTTVTSAITIGSSETDLTFDKAVKLTFAGQAGQHIGWYNHAGTFTEIAADCSATGGNDQAAQTTQLGAAGSCKMDVNGDLVVYTKHFSTFVTYTQTAVVSSGGGNGGGGGGGGGGIATGPLSIGFVNSTGSTGTTNGTGTGTGNGATGGQVLGASAYNFAVDLTIGSSNADVMQLQQVLIDAGYLNIAAPTGYFGALTRAAVMKWQAAHGVPATGFVGPLTRAALNLGSTPSSTTISGTTTFSTDLTVGSRGSDVVALQNMLIANGYLDAGLATGYFGPLTMAAVQKYQTAHGISATGYVGPLTRSALNTR